MVRLIWVEPLSIQITANNRAAIVAKDHSIGVEHRIILSMTVRRSCFASGVSAVTASKRPSIIHEAFDSPG